MRVAIEGCSHGSLHSIYSTIAAADARTNTKTDLLLLCGDFQAIRNVHDFPSMAVPPKYRQLGDFWEYYAGRRAAPVLTVVIGGNHECMAYMYHGGWLAPNIYYLGAAGSIYVHPTTEDASLSQGIRLAGLSGIYKSFDYRRGHFERVPFNEKSVKSAYHVREYEVVKLKLLSRRRDKSVIDMFMSHDWPVTITRYGNEERLLRQKPFFREEAKSGTLGSPPALEVLHHLAPAYWFSAHLHVKFAALVAHDELHRTTPTQTNGPRRENPDEIALNDVPGVGNPDEIDLGMDDSDDEEPSAQQDTKAGSIAVENPDEIDLGIGDSDDEEPCAKQATMTISVPEDPEAPTTIDPIESIDQVADIPDAQVAKDVVHNFAGTAVEEVARVRETILKEDEADGRGFETRFLALDKCGFGRDFIQFMEIPTGGPSTGPPRLQFDPEWLAISRAMHPFLPLGTSALLPTPLQVDTALTEARTWIKENIIDMPFDVQTLENGVTLQPLDIEQVQTFCFTAAPHDAPSEAQQPNQWYTNMQTEAFATFIGVENKVNPLPPGSSSEAV